MGTLKQLRAGLVTWPLSYSRTDLHALVLDNEQGEVAWGLADIQDASDHQTHPPIELPFGSVHAVLTMHTCMHVVTVQLPDVQHAEAGPVHQPLPLLHIHRGHASAPGTSCRCCNGLCLLFG